MKVVLDVSTLGLGTLYPQSRGGAYRVEQHLAEGLGASGECELSFCANHSSVAHEGCARYLREHPELGRRALLGQAPQGLASTARRGIAVAHRSIRTIVRSNVLPQLLRQAGRLVDRRLHPPVSDDAGSAEIFHSLQFALPPRSRGWRSPQRFLTIYDMAFLRFRDVFGPAYVRGAKEILASLGPEDWVITPSESTKSELCASGVVEPRRVFVTSLAADPRLFRPCADAERRGAVREANGIPDAPYLLCVSGMDRRKNAHSVVRAFAQLAEQEAVHDLNLVIVGHGGPGTRMLDDAVDAARALSHRIIRPGFVHDEHLAPLYSGAIGFVYPSLYEGFGLPPLEAMQCGTPVIACATSSLPEVVGDAGILLDPADGDALAAAMLRLYRDASLRESLSAKSRARAACFSWERCTRQTLAAYRAALA